MHHLKKNSHFRLHFVGIGGIGMSGLAEVFCSHGFAVSGSDLAETEVTQKLSSLGCQVFIGHHEDNVSLAHVVIRSSAIKEDNPEILRAQKLHIPIISRAEMLGELMRGKTGIAIAGSHGKTTTTSMMALILSSAQMDPTIVIGGKVDVLGGHARLGSGSFVVAEADESDGSFLLLPYTYTIITNIDNDHLDFYTDLESVSHAFIDFVKRAPFYGKAIVCGDDPVVFKASRLFSKPYLLYGFEEHNDWVAFDVKLHSRCSSFFVRYKGKTLGEFELFVPGIHNVLNALGCIAMAAEIGLSYEQTVQGLREFKGVHRRFEIHYESTLSRQVLIDDYAHHPTEILATLKCARQFWPGRIVCVFQPHRYTRFLQCWNAFLTCFENADLLLVSQVYSAGESPIKRVTAESFVSAFNKQGVHKAIASGDLLQTQKRIEGLVQSDDAILLLGAGSIHKIIAPLVSFLQNKDRVE
jgi:UDP-N-acetylmuramate--alanine ligase